MTIAIVAGGKLQKRFLKEIARADRIIGVDRGAAWLLRQGIIPDVAVGDFDSVTKKELHAIKKVVKDIRKQPPHPKYETDMEFAVDYAIAKNPHTVIIYGGLGSRLDHTIASIHLLEKLLAKGIAAKVVDANNEIFLIDKSMEFKRSKTHEYVSLHPVTAVAEAALTGFRYSVKRQVFIRGSTLGVSNEIVGDRARVIIHEGIVLVIRSRD